MSIITAPNDKIETAQRAAESKAPGAPTPALPNIPPPPPPFPRAPEFLPINARPPPSVDISPNNFPRQRDPIYNQPQFHPWRRSSRDTNGRQPLAVQIQRNRQFAPKPKVVEPVAAGHINDGVSGPLGPLGPNGPKGITWDDVVVAKPNPVSVKVSKPGQIIQLLVPVTIFVNDQWKSGPVKKPLPPRRPVRRNTNVVINHRRPGQVHG